MTFEEFTKLLRYNNMFLAKSKPWPERGIIERSYNKDDDIYIKWIIGGADGGSCWGDSPNPITAEEEPEFKDLDNMLEAVAEDISYLKYKKLVEAIVKVREETENGYYGNYYKYRIKSFTVGDLYDWLKKNNFI